MRNIFQTLERYNSSPENFLTEAFVFVLNSLLDTDRDAFLKILRKICIENSEFDFLDEESVFITTQEGTEDGRPDIRISSPDKYIYIEVKQDSPLWVNQICCYKKALEKRKEKIKKLILLTRFSVDLENQEKPYKQIRWYEIYNWLLEIAPRIGSQISGFLIKSFLDYLEEKKMTIQKIGWEYENGIISFRNLIDMIRISIEELPCKINRYSAGWEWMGFYFEKSKYFCGIYYAKPLIIVLEKYSSLKNKEDVDSFDFESEHFFCLDKDQQLEKIKGFIKSAYQKANIERS